MIERAELPVHRNSTLSGLSTLLAFMGVSLSNDLFLVASGDTFMSELPSAG
jgi:hypothetical protein